MKLDIQQVGDSVKLYEDGPFRGSNGMNYRGDNYYGYHVNYDYEIRVPRATMVDLKTINDGDIQVKGTSGDFAVHGLNGGIDMDGVSGSGVVAYAQLPGKLRVSFAKNPQRDCDFHLERRHGRLLPGAAECRPFLSHVEWRCRHAGTSMSRLYRRRQVRESCAVEPIYTAPIGAIAGVPVKAVRPCASTD